MPAYEESVPAHLWPLAGDGRVAARRLTAHLPSGAYLAASDEPKAWQTLAEVGAVIRVPRFGEVRREGEPWEDGFLEPRMAYVDGADHAGWEPRVEVATRFDSAVQDHLVRAAGRALVVASHGMAMTVWLTARIALPTPGPFWASLGLPDALTVDLRDGTVTRLPWPIA